jgi:hypothetical protein
VALRDGEICKYQVARFMYYCIRLHSDETGEHESLYALYAESIFIARLDTAERAAASVDMRQRCLPLSYFLLHEELFFSELASEVYLYSC